MDTALTEELNALEPETGVFTALAWEALDLSWARSLCSVKHSIGSGPCPDCLEFAQTHYPIEVFDLIDALRTQQGAA